MDVPIRLLTLALLVLPPLFLAIALLGNRLLLGPTALLVAIYAWIWLWFRPTRFSVQPRVLEIVWPLRRREIPRDDIATARLLDKRQLRQEVGRAMRVGAGGRVDAGGGPGPLLFGRHALARVALRLHASGIRGAVRCVVLLVVVDPVGRAGAGADAAADERALARALTAARDGAAERADRRAAEGADAGVLRGVDDLVVLTPLGPALGGRDAVALGDRAPCRRLELAARGGWPVWGDGSEGARATALRTTSTASGSARLRSVSSWRGSPSVATPARRATASETTSSQS